MYVYIIITTIFTIIVVVHDHFHLHLSLYMFYIPVYTTCLVSLSFKVETWPSLLTEPDVPNISTVHPTVSLNYKSQPVPSLSGKNPTTTPRWNAWNSSRAQSCGCTSVKKKPTPLGFKSFIQRQNKTATEVPFLQALPPKPRPLRNLQDTHTCFSSHTRPHIHPSRTFHSQHTDADGPTQTTTSCIVQSWSLNTTGLNVTTTALAS